MDDAEEIEHYERSIREAAIWCRTKDDDVTSLRSEELRPQLADRPSSGQLNAAVDTLTAARRTLLESHSANDVPQGRLLVCEVNDSVSSGESEFASEGFFDIDDRPPWDTWLFVLPRDADTPQPILVSWVPAALEELVQRGIDVNPIDCIRWLANSPRILQDWPIVRGLVKEELTRSTSEISRILDGPATLLRHRRRWWPF